MPGSPPTTTRLALPRYLDTADSVNYAGHYNAAADIIDAKVAKAAYRVSTLPVSPMDGDEINFANVDMGNQGVVWRLRYNASSSHARKWEYVGGPELYRVVTYESSVSFSPGWGNPGASGLDCQITCPLSGEYLVSNTATYEVETDDAAASHSGLSIGIGVSGGTPVADLVSSCFLVNPGQPAPSRFRMGETCAGFVFAALDGGVNYGQRVNRTPVYDTGFAWPYVIARRMAIVPIRVG